MTVNAVSPFQGLLVWVGKPREGTSQATGKPWKSVEFTIKFIDSQMQEQHMNFSLTGAENVNKLLDTPLNTEIIVTWRPSARQYMNPQTGDISWFPQNNSFAFRLAPQDQPEQQQAQPQTAQPQQPQPQATVQQPAPAPAAQPAAASKPVDDLPF